jgi:MoxR-like ATPase
MRQSKFYFRKPISLFLSLVFCFSQAAQAYSVSGLAVSSQASNPLDTVLQDPHYFVVPAKFARLGNVHKGNQKKLIIHIQDPHANLSGQENLKETLDQIISSYKINLVLSEGGEGDLTLAPFKQTVPGKVWERVVKSYFLKGRLTGEEYLNLTSRRSIKIEGIEDKALYDRNAWQYAKLAKMREEILAYLARCQSTVKRIKERLYPKSLLEYERLKTSDGQNMTKLFSLAREKKISFYPFWNIKRLLRLERKKQALDLLKSNVDWDALLKELEVLENQVYARYFSSGMLEADLQSLRFVDQYFELLMDACRTRMTPSQWSVFLTFVDHFEKAPAWVFLNRKLAEQGSLENLAPPSSILKLAQQEIKAFYELARRRDFVFIRNAQQVLKRENQSAAVLIAGGYHTPHLEQLMKEKGFSYIVLTPIVKDTTDFKKYERLVLTSSGANLKKDSLRPELVLERAKSLPSKMGLLQDLIREDNPQATLMSIIYKAVYEHTRSASRALESVKTAAARLSQRQKKAEQEYFDSLKECLEKLRQGILKKAPSSSFSVDENVDAIRFYLEKVKEGKMPPDHPDYEKTKTLLLEKLNGQRTPKTDSEFVYQFRNIKNSDGQGDKADKAINKILVDLGYRVRSDKLKSRMETKTQSQEGLSVFERVRQAVSELLKDDGLGLREDMSDFLTRLDLAISKENSEAGQKKTEGARLAEIGPLEPIEGYSRFFTQRVNGIDYLIFKSDTGDTMRWERGPKGPDRPVKIPDTKTNSDRLIKIITWLYGANFEYSSISSDGKYMVRKGEKGLVEAFEKNSSDIWKSLGQFSPALFDVDNDGDNKSRKSILQNLQWRFGKSVHAQMTDDILEIGQGGNFYAVENWPEKILNGWYLYQANQNLALAYDQKTGLVRFLAKETREGKIFWKLVCELRIQDTHQNRSWNAKYLELIGEPGVGKDETMLAVATLLNLPLDFMAGNEDVNVQDLTTGRRSIGTEEMGTAGYDPAPAAKRMHEGGIYTVRESHKLRPGVLNSQKPHITSSDHKWPIRDSKGYIRLKTFPNHPFSRFVTSANWLRTSITGWGTVHNPPIQERKVVVPFYWLPPQEEIQMQSHYALNYARKTGKFHDNWEKFETEITLDIIRLVKLFSEFRLIFKGYSGEQSEILLSTFNDWLESGRSPDRQEEDSWNLLDPVVLARKMNGNSKEAEELKKLFGKTHGPAYLPEEWLKRAPSPRVLKNIIRHFIDYPKDWKYRKLSVIKNYFNFAAELDPANTYEICLSRLEEIASDDEKSEPLELDASSFVIEGPHLVIKPKNETSWDPVIVPLHSRASFRTQGAPPDEILRWVKISENALKFYRWAQAHARGMDVIFVGKPGSGKTTLANAIQELLNSSDGEKFKIEMHEEMRKEEITFDQTLVKYVTHFMEQTLPLAMNSEGEGQIVHMEETSQGRVNVLSLLNEASERRELPSPVAGQPPKRGFPGYGIIHTINAPGSANRIKPLPDDFIERHLVIEFEHLPAAQMQDYLLEASKLRNVYGHEAALNFKLIGDAKLVDGKLQQYEDGEIKHTGIIGIAQTLNHRKLENPDILPPFREVSFRLLERYVQAITQFYPYLRGRGMSLQDIFFDLFINIFTLEAESDEEVGQWINHILKAFIENDFWDPNPGQDAIFKFLNKEEVLSQNLPVLKLTDTGFSEFNHLLHGLQLDTTGRQIENLEVLIEKTWNDKNWETFNLNEKWKRIYLAKEICVVLKLLLQERSRPTQGPSYSISDQEKIKRILTKISRFFIVDHHWPKEVLEANVSYAGWQKMGVSKINTGNALFDEAIAKLVVWKELGRLIGLAPNVMTPEQKSWQKEAVVTLEKIGESLGLPPPPVVISDKKTENQSEKRIFKFSVNTESKPAKEEQKPKQSPYQGLVPDSILEKVENLSIGDSVKKRTALFLLGHEDHLSNREVADVVMPLVLEMLNEEDSSIIRVALYAIRKMAPYAASAVPILKEHVERWKQECKKKGTYDKSRIRPAEKAIKEIESISGARLSTNQIISLRQTVNDYHRLRKEMIQALDFDDESSFRERYQKMKEHVHFLSSSTQNATDEDLTLAVHQMMPPYLSRKLEAAAREMTATLRREFTAVGTGHFDQKTTRLIENVVKEVVAQLYDDPEKQKEEFERITSDIKTYHFSNIIPEEIMQGRFSDWKKNVQWLLKKLPPILRENWGNTHFVTKNILLHLVEDELTSRCSLMHELVHYLSHRGIFKIPAEWEEIAYAVDIFERVTYGGVTVEEGEKRLLDAEKELGQPALVELYQRGKEMALSGKTAFIIKPGAVDLRANYFSMEVLLQEACSVFNLLNLNTAAFEEAGSYQSQQVVGILIAGILIGIQERDGSKIKPFALLRDFFETLYDRYRDPFAGSLGQNEFEGFLAELGVYATSLTGRKIEFVAKDSGPWVYVPVGDYTGRIEYVRSDLYPRSYDGLESKQAAKERARGHVFLAICQKKYGLQKLQERFPDSIREHPAFLAFSDTLSLPRILKRGAAFYSGSRNFVMDSREGGIARWIFRVFKDRYEIGDPLAEETLFSSIKSLHLQYLDSLLYRRFYYDPNKGEIKDPRVKDWRVERAIAETLGEIDGHGPIGWARILLSPLAISEDDYIKAVETFIWPVYVKLYEEEIAQRELKSIYLRKEKQDEQTENLKPFGQLIKEEIESLRGDWQKLPKSTRQALHSAAKNAVDERTRGYSLTNPSGFSVNSSVLQNKQSFHDEALTEISSFGRVPLESLALELMAVEKQLESLGSEINGLSANLNQVKQDTVKVVKSDFQNLSDSVSKHEKEIIERIQNTSKNIQQDTQRLLEQGREIHSESHDHNAQIVFLQRQLPSPEEIKPARFLAGNHVRNAGELLERLGNLQTDANALKQVSERLAQTLAEKNLRDIFGSMNLSASLERQSTAVQEILERLKNHVDQALGASDHLGGVTRELESVLGSLRGTLHETISGLERYSGQISQNVSESFEDAFPLISLRSENPSSFVLPEKVTIKESEHFVHLIDEPKREQKFLEASFHKVKPFDFKNTRKQQEVLFEKKTGLSAFEQQEYNSWLNTRISGSHPMTARKLSAILTKKLQLLTLPVQDLEFTTPMEKGQFLVDVAEAVMGGLGYVDTKKSKPKSLSVTFLTDTSASMRNKIEMLKCVLFVLLNSFLDHNLERRRRGYLEPIGGETVIFNTNSTTILDHRLSAKNFQKERLIYDAIKKIVPSGKTKYGMALRKAISKILAEKNTSGEESIRILFVLSDEEVSSSEAKEVTDLVEMAKNKGISIFIVPMGGPDHVQASKVLHRSHVERVIDPNPLELLPINMTTVFLNHLDPSIQGVNWLDSSQGARLGDSSFGGASIPELIRQDEERLKEVSAVFERVQDRLSIEPMTHVFDLDVLPDQNDQWFDTYLEYYLMNAAYLKRLPLFKGVSFSVKSSSPQKLKKAFRHEWGWILDSSTTDDLQVQLTHHKNFKNGQPNIPIQNLEVGKTIPLRAYIAFTVLAARYHARSPESPLPSEMLDMYESFLSSGFSFNERDRLHAALRQFLNGEVSSEVIALARQFSLPSVKFIGWDQWLRFFDNMRRMFTRSA